MRDALAAGTAIPPIRLPWLEAGEALVEAGRRAVGRVPHLAAALAEWAAALPPPGAAPEWVLLDVAEFANFYDDAAGFLGELRRGAGVWHGDGPPDLPSADDAGRDLTGFDDATDAPFPRAMPELVPPAASPPSGPEPPSALRRWIARLAGS